ncbi:helix-turn-helix domain-containing protein [Microbulbifer variabilis]|uniref:helix-turn-helix domain-containing protein n=1 Tax=Microbulbifer variabilis TaxID=266805 RepID=UPI001CFE1CB2|nr:helix-turn-helix domain-containing protein [Microbulbifer variabilis]
MADMDVCGEVNETGDLGARLKLVRKIYGISQRQLARQAGVTNATVSFIEQGRVSPSVGSLEKILNSVPMSLAEFFSLNLAEPEQIFFRASEMPEIGDGQVVCYLLGGAQQGRSMSIIRKVFPAGQDSGSGQLLLNGEVGGIVIAGELEVTAGSDFALLEVGDGYYFSARRPHRFHNPGSTDCVVISAVTASQPHIAPAPLTMRVQQKLEIQSELRHGAEQAD